MATLVLFAVAVACSVSSKKNEGLDENVKIFLTDFQSKLTGSEKDLFKLFQTFQKSDEIRKAIAILGNSDPQISATIIMSEAELVPDPSFLVILVPVELTGQGQSAQRTFCKIQLVRKGKKLFVSRLDAEELYTKYISVKNEIENAAALDRLMADRKIYYDKSIELKKGYDSVVWYAHHKNMTYYYVVKGEYTFESIQPQNPQNFKMGLLDETGKVIVPAEFDLIGNPSMHLEGAVEVRNEGKIGYYSLEGKELVPANFEWLIPYDADGAAAIVKNVDGYGWFDTQFTFKQGLPSAGAEESVRDFAFLTGNTFALGKDHQDLINILYPPSGEANYQSIGLVISPAYFVVNHIFELVNSGFMTPSSGENAGYQFGNDYIESSTEKPFSLSETLDAFISVFKTRYIGGRGEFYSTRKIILLDKDRNIVGDVGAFGDQDFEFTKLENGLFQAKAVITNDMEYGPANAAEINYPYYSFYELSGQTLTAKNSSRRFSFTEFVKMDSSYLTGNFDFYDREAQRNVNTSFVSDETLRLMRDEILAANGYIFEDPERHNYFSNYKPLTKSYDEVYSNASEIDRYNLDFLVRMVGKESSESGDAG